MDRQYLEETRRLLDKETPVILADIRSIYAKLDRKFGLRGARIPISFGYEDDLLGSYTRGNGSIMEHFHFSLLFVGYSVPKPLDRCDRVDLYLHEYAHYMQYNMEIPKQYTWQPGIHGSAWKYCCSLIGAAPTPYYKAGESLMHHDYEKLLTRKKRTAVTVMQDTLQREREYQDKKNSQLLYRVGDKVSHPKFGEGTVEAIEQLSGSVRLQIQFPDQSRKIDQKWLAKTNYHRSG